MRYYKITNPHQDLNLNYHGFYRTKITRDGRKIYGTMFILSKKLEDNQKSEILKYPNTLLYYSQSQYAPELKNNAILILDKKIR